MRTKVKLALQQIDFALTQISAMINDEERKQIVEFLRDKAIQIEKTITETNE